MHLISGFGGMFREQVRSVKKGDVVIAISFAPYGKETQYCGAWRSITAREDPCRHR